MLLRSVESAFLAVYDLPDQPWEAATGAYSLAQAEGQLDRLVDEALSGERVTLTRDGRTVVTLTPTLPEPPEPEPLTDEFLQRMRERARARPSLGGDSVTLVREMREEDP